MQFDDPRSALEAAAAKPTRGIDAAALVRKGQRMRRARLTAATAGMAIVVAAASASFGMLADDRDGRPGPAAPSPEKSCATGNRVSFFLGDGVPADDGRDLARLLDEQVRNLNARSSAEYVSKRQAYRELVKRYRGTEPENYEDLPWTALPARLDFSNVDEATIERLEQMLAQRVDTIQKNTSTTGRDGVCTEVVEGGPPPEATSTPDTEPPVAPGEAQGAVVRVLRAECRTSSVDRSINFDDATRWCRFVLLVDNQGSRWLRLDAGDQVLRSANGEANTAFEDGMSGDFSTRLFTSPIPPGRRRMGQVIVLAPPDDVPAALEIHPRPGFAPASFPLEYDCARDLHDEPGGRCFLSLGAETVTLDQTWIRTSVTLYHCGVDPVQFRGREWVVPDPPFDATNAPEGFTGQGLFKQRSARDALYYDDGGEVVHFEALEGWEPPPCA